MTDFSVPQRMSLGAFVVYFLKFFRYIFNAAIILITYEIFKSGSGFVGSLLKVVAMIGCVAALALLLASMSFFKIRFHVEGGNLIYRHRLIGNATTTIPLNRIHTLRTRQGLFYRLFGLRGILFDTLASKEEEIELILSESDWQNLLNRIERQERPQPVAADVPPVYSPSSFMRSAVGIAMVMAFTYMVSLVLWLGKVLLRYYNLSLVYDSKMLTFSHGLFSRLSSRFSRDKICTLWIKRNYFEKRFGLCTLALKQALSSSAQKEEDNLKIYGHDCSEFFLGWWLGQGYESETDIIAAKSGKGVFALSLLPDLFLSSVAVAALCYFGLYGWIILPVIYLLVCIPKGLLMMRHSSISLRESYLVVSKGSFAEIKNYLKYENVEVVRITRSTLSRFTGRVSLYISTSGSSFTVRSLVQDQVLSIYELLLAKSMSVKNQALTDTPG